MAKRRPAKGRLSPRLLQDAAERAKRGPRDKPKRVVVHLGNIDDYGQLHDHTVTARKTRMYSERFPNVEFVGIDKRPLRGERPENLTQYLADFKEGLEKRGDASVDVISSEYALGYYDREQTLSEASIDRHARSVIKTAFAKLKEGGKIHIVVSEKVCDRVVSVLASAGFKPEKIKTHPLPKSHLKRTYAIERFGGGIQISAEK